MADEQTSNQPLFGSGVTTPKTNDPVPQVNGDVSFEQTLKNNFPEYRGESSFHIRKKLLEDGNFFNEVSQKVFNGSYNEQEFQTLAQDQELYQTEFSKFKKNFRQFVDQRTHTGEDPETTLVRRSVDVAQDNIPFDNYVDTVTQNKNKYKKFGLVTDNGDFMYGNDRTAFQQELQANPQLHAEIESDRFNAFNHELGKNHNDADLISSPEEKTKAWIVYDKLGPQGLTQYMNAKQEARSIAAGAETRREATEYLENVRIGDESLNDYYERYVVGTVEDTEYGKDIAKVAYDYGIDPAILSGLVEQESSFNPNAVSYQGAVGLTQFMPSTGKEFGLRVPQELVDLDRKRVNAETPAERKRYERELVRKTEELGINPERDERYDPQKVLGATGKYFQKANEEFGGDVDAMIASYHQGFGGVRGAISDSTQTGEDWVNYIGPKGRDYLTKIKGRAKNFEGKVDRGLVFNPPTTNKEVSRNVPRDLNNYTSDKYTTEGELVDFTEYANKWAEENVPESHEGSFDVKRLVEDTDSEEYVSFTQSIWEDAVQEEGIETQDLIDTLLASKRYVREDSQGNPVYGLDYNSMTWQQKTAFDAMSNDREFAYMVEDLGNGQYNFQPQRREEAKARWQDAFNWLQNTKKEYVFNEAGEAELIEKPDDGFWAGVQNSLATFLMGGASEVMQYVFTPMARGLNMLAEETGVGEDFARNAVNVTTQLSGVDPSAELTTSDSHGAFVAGVGEVAPFAWYMMSMFGVGKAAVTGVGKIAQKATQSKTILDGVRLGRSMPGSPKFAAMSERLAHGVSTKAPWTTGTGIFYTGGAIKESLTPSERSFYNVVPELFGYDQTNDLSQLYNNTNSFGKVGLDIAGSLVFDLFADTLIASARYGGAKGMQKFFNKTEFNSIKWDADNGRWKTTNSPQFAHDIRTFWHNLTDDLAGSQLGSIGDTMAKARTKGATPETVHDFVKQFTDKTSAVTTNLKQEIRSNAQFVQSKLGDGTRLSDEQLDRIVDDQYNHFIDGVAETLSTTLRTSGDTSLPLKWANAMEQQIPTVTRRGDIRPERASFHRERGENIVVKDGEVFEIDDKMWAVDIAGKMRQKALSAQTDEIIDRRLRSMDIDPKNPRPQDLDKIDEVEREVRGVVGRGIDIGGNIGYVVDVDDSGYVVAKADGTTQRITNVSQRLDQDELNKNLMQSISDRITRQFLRRPQQLSVDMRPQEPAGLLPPPREEVLGPAIPTPDGPPQPLRLPPPKYAKGIEGDILDVERNLMRRVDETDELLERTNTRIDNEVYNLEQRLKNIDMIEYVDPGAPAKVRKEVGARKGVVKRQLRRDIDSLKERKLSEQQRIKDLKRERGRELSLFYIRNTELQDSRMREVIEAQHARRQIEQIEQIKNEKFNRLAQTYKEVASKQTRIPFC